MIEKMLSKKLEMAYTTDLNTKIKVFVENPLESLDSETVSATMEAIVGKGVLRDNKGNMITAAIGARILKVSEMTFF